MRELLALPKAHLHVHLEGAMRPSTLTDLATRQGLPVPPGPGEEGFSDFTAFLVRYAAAAASIATEADLRRLVREVVDDAAADGAVWVEPQTNPLRHVEKLGPLGHVVEVMLDEGALAAAAAGVGFGMILSHDRRAPVELAIELAEAAVAHAGSGVVGFGLASDEVVGPPELFARAFDIAREAGLLSVPHAGELVGPASIRGALDALGAVRIAHGVRVVEDAELLARIAGEGVVLDVCPTSNAALGVVADLASHPLPALLAAGVRCSINADDPLLFGPGLLAEYEVSRSVLSLSDDALAACARTSIQASGAPAALKASAVAGVEEWLA